VDILGVPVHRLTFAQALERLATMIALEAQGYVVTANPEIIMRARRDPDYLRILRGAAMVWPDGIGVLWAARLLGHAIPERVTGSDGVPRIAERAAREGWRLYFLGAAPGVAARAAIRLQSRYPGLQVVGAEAGDPGPAYDECVRAHINSVKPDIVLVAYGAPKQERWIARNLPHVRTHVAIGVGGAFDFITGVQRRAPKVVRQVGLEWLWRLALEPRRWRRQMALPQFAWLVLKQRWRERKTIPP